MDSESGYPVALKRGALNIEQVAHQVRRAFLDQEECRQIGEFAMGLPWTWEQVFEEFKSVLKYGSII